MASLGEMCHDEAGLTSIRKGDPPMRIKRLSIQDFRGFRRFEMNELGRINLIVGSNNCGKTTVLEAISILMAHGNPAAIWTVLSRRGEVIWVEHDEPAKGSSKFYEVQQLFRGFEIGVGTQFRLAADAETGTVEMVAKVGDDYRPSQPQGPARELLHANLPPEFLTARTLSLSWSNERSQPSCEGGPTGWIAAPVDLVIPPYAG